MKILMFIFILSLSQTIVVAHEGEKHEASKPQMQDAKIIKIINTDYVAEVKPIFERKCFDCHSSQTRYPWYYKIPGAKQLIDHDVAESKEHLDMDNDFPFKGHGDPQEDLEAIKKSVLNGSMPPWRYRIAHLNSSLTEDEKKIITEWADKGLSLFSR